MSAYLTPEKVKQKYIEEMGEELGPLFFALWNEVAWLFKKWNEYVELYGKKPSRIDLLNRVAPKFFRIVQDSLWEDILMHIARLTDPSQSCGKDNLTIQRLPNLVEDQIKDDILRQIDELKEKTSFSRDWRNRHIAHCDFNLAMEVGTEPLEGASRAKIRDALNSIEKVLNAISTHYSNSRIMFNLVKPHGAEDLLYVLDDGLKADSERRKRIEAGEGMPEDSNIRDL